MFMGDAIDDLNRGFSKIFENLAISSDFSKMMGVLQEDAISIEFSMKMERFCKTINIFEKLLEIRNLSKFMGFLIFHFLQRNIMHKTWTGVAETSTQVSIRYSKY
jgi:hypothetical protein